MHQLVAETSGPVAEFLRSQLPEIRFVDSLLMHRSSRRLMVLFLSRRGSDAEEISSSEEAPVASTSQMQRKEEEDVEMISSDEHEAQYIPRRRIKREPDAFD